MSDNPNTLLLMDIENHRESLFRKEQFAAFRMGREPATTVINVDDAVRDWYPFKIETSDRLLLWNFR